MRVLGRSVWIVMLVAGCAGRAADAPTAVFLCGETRVAVIFRADSAYITLPDTSVALPLAISASGARYSDGLATFWEHQGTARLELERDTLEACAPINRVRR